MTTETPPDRPPDPSESPLYWLAVLRSARTSRDALLEQDARKRLAAFGVRIVFEDQPAPTRAGEVGRQ